MNNDIQNHHPRGAHEIDYIIHGNDMQYVEIALDPGETALSEPGAMMYMEQGIQMETKMSDGSDKNSGLMGSLMGAAKRSMTGESIFLSFFTNKGNSKVSASFAAPYPGRIVPLDLQQLGGKVLCQKGSFLCAAKGVAIGFGFTKKIGAGMFGGEGYVLQKLEGDGLAFIHVGGTVSEIDIQEGRTVYVDTGSVVAFQASVGFDIQVVKGFSNIMFGGEEFFLSAMKGPGKLWVQSMPYTRMVHHIQQTMIAINKGKK